MLCDRDRNRVTVDSVPVEKMKDRRVKAAHGPEERAAYALKRTECSLWAETRPGLGDGRKAS